MNRTAASAVAVVLAVTALTGCGVPAEDSPRPISPPPGPYPGLTRPAPTAGPSGPATEKLFLVKDQNLVMVTQHRAAPPTVATTIGDLLAEPGAAERASGFTSALSGIDLVAHVHVVGQTAVVEIGANLDEAARNDEVLAFGQVVCTLTAIPRVARVSFQQDGAVVGVPRADGSLTKEPLTAADYATLVDR